jgi:hypothetical protein
MLADAPREATMPHTMREDVGEHAGVIIALCERDDIGFEHLIAAIKEEARKIEDRLKGDD